MTPSSSGLTPSASGIRGKTAAPSGTSLSAASLMSASSHGGDNGQLVAILDRRIQIIEVSNVLIIEIDIDEAAQLTRLLEQSVGDAGKLPAKIIEGRLHGSSRCRYFRLAAGVLPHRRRHVDFDRHEILTYRRPNHRG